MYMLQIRQLQSSPFQLLNCLLNTARFSDSFKLSGNACQSSELRNDADSIPYVVVLEETQNYFFLKGIQNKSDHHCVRSVELVHES